MFYKRSGTLTALCMLLASPALAQGRIPDAPSITGIVPPSGQRGATVEVTLSGQGMEGTKELMCRYSAYPNLIPMQSKGLKAQVLSANDGQVKARITIPADAPAGLHEIRALSSLGVTTPEYFYVSQYAQHPEKEPNNGASQAQKVTLPLTLAGVIQGGNDQDCYSFDAKAGETLIFDVEGFKRFAPGQNNQEGIVYLDSFIVLMDQAGRELAYDDDSSRVDAFLAYKFPQDGTYTVGIRDSQYRGRGDFHYRLTIGKRPTITAIFPPGGQAGGALSTTVYGFNLDGKGATTMRRGIRLPSRPGVDEFRITTADGISNAVPVVAGAVPETPEKEPNNRATNATSVIAPVTCSGMFDSLDDVDGFRFQGQGGQMMIFEVEAARLGSPVDPFISVVTRSGKVIGTNDDAVGMDSRLEVRLPTSEEYAVIVRNQTRTGFGPQYYYRLTIRPRKQSFSAQLQQEGLNRLGAPVNVNVDSVAVEQGGETEFDLMINRREGQSGDIQVILSLPPNIKGLDLDQVIKPPRMGNMPPTMPPKIIADPVVKNGQNRISLKVKAPATAAPGNYLNCILKLQGTADGKPFTVEHPFWVTVSPI